MNRRTKSKLVDVKKNRRRVPLAALNPNDLVMSLTLSVQTASQLANQNDVLTIDSAIGDVIHLVSVNSDERWVDEGACAGDHQMFLGISDDEIVRVRIKKPKNRHIIKS